MAARQIVKLADLRASATDAVYANRTINDCPDEYLEFVEEWQQAFRKAQFDRACALATQKDQK